MTSNASIELPTTADALLGWRLRLLRFADPSVVELSGEAEHPILERTDDPADRVDGGVFEVTREQLAAADDYAADDYEIDVCRRVPPAASGGDTWVYSAT